MKFPVSIFLKSAPLLSVLAITGCATSPPPSLSGVQHQLAARDELQVVWPVSATERTAIDQAVAEILKNDLTPESAARVALLNNRGMRAVLEDVGISQADVIAASRLRNPTLAASVRWPDHTPRGPIVGLALAADLLDTLLIPLRRSVAQAQLGQTEQRVAHEALRLVAETKSAVFTVQARQQLCQQLKTILEVNEAGADLAQRQYDAGNINRLELTNLQLAAQQSKLELARTEAQLRSDREMLNRLLGLSGAQTTWKTSVELPALPSTDSLDSTLEELALVQRLDLAAAKTQVDLAERALRLRRNTRYLPASVNLGVETERETTGSRLTGPSVEIALPIFDQGQGDLARLSAELRRTVSLYEGLVIAIRSEVRESRDALRTARETVDYYRRTLLPQRSLLLRETLLHYNAMQKSNYELLAAKEQMLIAERDAIETQRDYWIARVQLERVVGGRLTAASLAASPEHHSDFTP